MRTLFIAILFYQFTTSVGAQNRDSIISEELTFLIAGENLIRDTTHFGKEPIGLLRYRIDSVFKSYWIFSYTFKSYDTTGVFLGRGSFHLHEPEGENRYSIEQSDSIILNHSKNLIVHVLSLMPTDHLGQSQSAWVGTCHFNSIELNPMKSGMLWGSQTGLLFSGEDIQRMPGR